MAFLSQEDMIRLTGHSDPEKQTQWLNEREWAFLPDNEGYPVVCTAYFELRSLLDEEKHDNGCYCHEGSKCDHGGDEGLDKTGCTCGCSCSKKDENRSLFN